MVAVPNVRPVINPDAFIVATEGSLLLQVPLVVVSENRVVVVTQTLGAPVTTPADGNGLTVIGFVMYAVPQLLLTV